MYANRQETISIPRLEPKDLYDRRVRRDHARLKAYNTLLEQIYHRIYATSQLPGNTSSVLYSVPPFILGLPKLDSEDCIVYLVWQLRESKFEVRFTWPNLLWISWRHHEGEYLTKQNPIIQAMMPEITAKKKPEAPKAPKAKAYNQDIELITNGRQSGFSNFGLQPSPARSAMDYQPPDSFIQNLDRPARPFPSPGQGQGQGQSQGQTQQQKIKGNILADLWA
jgi:hypothetical protein